MDKQIAYILVNFNQLNKKEEKMTTKKKKKKREYTI